jgi:hypothetical protein
VAASGSAAGDGRKGTASHLLRRQRAQRAACRRVRTEVSVSCARPAQRRPLSALRLSRRARASSARLPRGSCGARASGRTATRPRGILDHMTRVHARKVPTSVDQPRRPGRRGNVRGRNWDDGGSTNSAAKNTQNWTRPRPESGALVEPGGRLTSGHSRPRIRARTADARSGAATQRHILNSSARSRAHTPAPGRDSTKFGAQPPYGVASPPQGADRPYRGRALGAPGPPRPPPSSQRSRACPHPAHREGRTRPAGGSAAACAGSGDREPRRASRSTAASTAHARPCVRLRPPHRPPFRDGPVRRAWTPRA